MRARKKGGKLFESREKRDKFLTSPRACASQGEPKAKLLGGFSLVRFFVPHKEMNIKVFKIKIFQAAVFFKTPSPQPSSTRGEGAIICRPSSILQVVIGAYVFPSLEGRGLRGGCV